MGYDEVSCMKNKLFCLSCGLCRWTLKYVVAIFSITSFWPIYTNNDERKKAAQIQMRIKIWYELVTRLKSDLEILTQLKLLERFRKATFFLSDLCYLWRSTDSIAHLSEKKKYLSKSTIDHEIKNDTQELLHYVRINWAQLGNVVGRGF